MTQMETTTARRSAVTHQRRLGAGGGAGAFLARLAGVADLALRDRADFSGFLTMRYLGRSRDSTEPSIDRR